MSKFTDNLWSDLVREHASTLAHTDRPAGGPAGRVRRGRIVAGGTLGLAGVGTALMLALTAGGAAAPPAFAITTNHDGTLTVDLSNPGEGLFPLNRRLAKDGYDEHVNFTMAQGPASSPGVVSCVPQGNVPGPAIQVTVGPGDSNTETIAAGNTGAGTWHVASCQRYRGAYTKPIVGDRGMTEEPIGVGRRAKGVSRGTRAAAVGRRRSSHRRSGS